MNQPAKKEFSITRVGIALLVVLAFFVLIGLGSGVRTSGHGSATRARGACSNLVQAVQAYYDDYNTLPTPLGSKDPIQTDKILMNILVGFDKRENPKEVRYYQGLDAKGSSHADARRGVYYDTSNNAWLRDPWGHPYFVLCDHDYDGEITDPW